MKIGVDLDGVCYEFGGSFRTYVVLRGLRDSKDCPPPQRWEFYEDWGFSLQEFIQLCHEGVNDGVIFSHGDPFPGVREGMEMLRAAGHRIQIVTDRTFGEPGKSAEATLRWLHLHQLPYDSITFSAQKDDAHLDAMVDDKPENYAALEAAGIDAYLLTRAWNQHVEGARRVLDLYHFAEVICS